MFFLNIIDQELKYNISTNTIVVLFFYRITKLALKTFRKKINLK